MIVVVGRWFNMDDVIIGLVNFRILNFRESRLASRDCHGLPDWWCFENDGKWLWVGWHLAVTLALALALALRQEFYGYGGRSRMLCRGQSWTSLAFQRKLSPRIVGERKRKRERKRRKLFLVPVMLGWASPVTAINNTMFGIAFPLS